MLSRITQCCDGPPMESECDAIFFLPLFCCEGWQSMRCLPPVRTRWSTVNPLYIAMTDSEFASTKLKSVGDLSPLLSLSHAITEYHACYSRADFRLFGSTREAKLFGLVSLPPV